MPTEISGSTGVNKIQDGTVVNADIDTLDASKLTGTVADARISTLTASKLTGTYPNFLSTGVDDNATAVKLTVSDSGININGDITFSAASQGICLGVTSNTDANTLDDYEEGTWTPTNNGGSISLSVNEANYTKIGRLVTVQAYLGTSADGDGTEMRIGGLPFAAHNTTYESAIGRFSTYGDTANVYVSTTSGQTYLWVITKNTFLNEDDVDGAGGDWNFSLTYHTN